MIYRYRMKRTCLGKNDSSKHRMSVQTDGLFRCGDSVDRRHFLRPVIITLLTDTERERLKEIERFYQTSIVELPQDISTLL